MKTSVFISSNILYVIIIAFSFLIGVSACSQKQKPSSKPAEQALIQHPFAAPIEQAHNMKSWDKKGALKTMIEVGFGNQPPLHATLYVETSGPGIRLEMGSDTVAVFDGTDMWSMPSDSAVGPFTLKTWAYFLKAPYKLDDPGTHIASQSTAQWNGNTYDTAKLTFDAGTGDSPDDWFVLYRNQSTHLLDAMAYIVTYGGKSVEEANKNPHAISYENFKTIDGIPMATTWRFWHWDTGQGFSDESIGQAQLTNMQFVKTDDLFAKPEGAMMMKRSK